MSPHQIVFGGEAEKTNDNAQFEKLSNDYFQYTNIKVNDDEKEANLSPEHALYVKDCLNLSDQAYDLIRKEFNCKIPSLYQIKFKRKVLNRRFPIQELEKYPPRPDMIA